MVKSLRNRLILSHILPMLIVIPIMGIALVYFLETRVFLPALSRQLENDIVVLAAYADKENGIWSNPDAARAFLQEISLNPEARYVLMTPDGVVLASSEPDIAAGSHLELPAGLDPASPVPIVFYRYSQRVEAEVIDVLLPVFAENGEIIGIIRGSLQYASIADELLQMRYVISGIVLLGLLLGGLLGSILAISIGNPIRRITRRIEDLAHGSSDVLVMTNGPDEVITLANTVNYLTTRLHVLEKSRQQLLANLVHELGRPLGALRSAIQALNRGAMEDPDLTKDLLEGMDQETARLQHLLEELSHLHRQVFGSLELNRQHFNLKKWLDTFLPPWREAASSKQIHWLENAPDEDLSIYADPDRLAQILGNLVSNAVKFTPDGGTIWLETKTFNHEIHLSVGDTGPGIPEEEQGNVFKPFFQGVKGRRYPQGMGLGLSIAWDLAVAHGGRLEMESQAGEGSLFTFVLPEDGIES